MYLNIVRSGFRSILENHFLVHKEVDETADSDCNEVTPYYIPSGQALQTQQEQHLKEEYTCIGSVELEKMLQIRLQIFALHAVAPNQFAGGQEIDQGGAFEGDYRRNNILAHITLEDYRRQKPQDKSVRGGS